MQKKLRFFLLLLVFVLLLGGAYAGYRKLQPSVNTPDAPISVTPAESFADCTVYDANGEPVALSSLLGKPVFLNFWATWCPYCVEEFPELQRAFEEYGDKVHFAMINYTDGVRETVETASAFTEENGYTFPVYYDLDSAALEQYGVFSFPTSALLSADGVLTERRTGAVTYETVVSWFEEILAKE